jgi:hypothetical protein
LIVQSGVLSALRTATYAEFEKARHSASTFAAASPLVHWAKAELEQGPKAESKSNRPFFA